MDCEATWSAGCVREIRCHAERRGGGGLSTAGHVSAVAQSHGVQGCTTEAQLPCEPVSSARQRVRAGLSRKPSAAPSCYAATGEVRGEGMARLWRAAQRLNALWSSETETESVRLQRPQLGLSTHHRPSRDIVLISPHCFLPLSLAVARAPLHGLFTALHAALSQLIDAS